MAYQVYRQSKEEPSTTGTSYKHSSWLAMMRDRTICGLRLLSNDSVSYISIDDNELANLLQLLHHTCGQDNHLATLARRTKVGGGSAAHHFAVEHDYVLAWAKDKSQTRPLDIPHDPDYAKRYAEVDEVGPYFWDTMERSSTQTTPYKIKAPDGQWLEGRWFRSEERFKADLKTGEVRFLKKPDGSWAVQFKQRMADGKKIRSLLSDNDYKSRQEDLTDLGLAEGFSYPKPINLIIPLAQASTDAQRQGECVLDYFAGSGTTGHAIIALNRQDGGTRQFVLVEMGDYFDTVLLPRIKKVTFAPEWKDGKPVRRATEEEAQRSPRIVKYIRLESYEDALNNIKFTGETKTLYDFDDYMLQYMLKWETKESTTLLNIEQLASPFTYKLQITEGQETRVKVVDLPETFAYLLGLQVSTRCVLQDKDRRYVVYHGSIDHREVVVIWRDSAGWEKKDYERDKKFVGEHKLTEGANEIFINGDSLIPKARSLDGVFKSRMFGGL